MKYILFLVIVFVCLYVNVNAQKHNPETVFKSVEQMPEAPYDVMKYLTDNIHYPDSAIQNNIEGKVYVQFVVSSTGEIDDVKELLAVKRHGHGLEEEAIRVVSNMPKWKPGKQNGRPVDVFYGLPVYFKLNNKSKQIQYNTPPEILRYTAQMPMPNYDVNEYFAKHIDYPQKARKNNIEGQVFVKFIVTQDGSLDSVHTEGDTLGYGLEEAAIKMVKNMPRWEPGKQNAKPLRVYFTQPITFKLKD